MKQKKLLLLPLLFLCGFLFAQNNAVLPDKAGTWVLDKTVANVVFYHKIATCDGKKVVFFKFNNKNTKAVTVTWKEVFVTQWKNIQKAGIVSEQKQLLLAPGITSGSDCENNIQKILLTRPRQAAPVYEEEIVQFNFKEISVTK